jgi:uncharacterized protein YbjT (DUF2867 family)
MVVATAADTVAVAADARVALVAGATGLVGQAVLAALLVDNHYAHVHTVGRRTLPMVHTKLTQHVVDFAAPTSWAGLPHIDDCFIALGTTIKVAGSQAAFKAIDFEAVIAAARTGIGRGATKLGVVSAMGADPKSSIFYNQVKGEMEKAVAQLGFKTLVLVRPAMLAGDREALNQPVRSGERMGLLVTRLLRPLIPANYQSVNAKDVAAALVHALKTSKPGTTCLLSGALQGAAATH